MRIYSNIFQQIRIGILNLLWASGLCEDAFSDNEIDLSASDPVDIPDIVGDDGGNVVDVAPSCSLPSVGVALEDDTEIKQ